MPEPRPSGRRTQFALSRSAETKDEEKLAAAGTGEIAQMRSRKRRV